jgi:glycosyltransferase involved in cell wall biosynthesis
LRRLVQAYRLLVRDQPGVPPLVLVGAQGWGPALELDSLPAGSVITTGYLADQTLRQVVAGASCLAFPSLYEGFGLPPVEALACGVPVVAADLPVTREVLGSAARLVTGTEVATLAEALGAELNREPDEALAETRRAQARLWTWQGCAEATWRAYASALS